jgi:CHAT domain-containing protein/tetratricopeptide (TPR) repeat protein
MPEDPADASFAHTTTATCPACGASHTADIWLIVAPDERPDLVEQIRNGSLHTVTCPQCSQTHTPDAPLLIFRPTAASPILFSPAQQTTSEQDQQHAAALIGILRQRLGAAWNDAWLAQGPTVVPRQLLPLALADDPAAALQELAVQMQQALAELRRRDPEAFARLEAEAQQAMAALLAADQTPDEAPASAATTDAPALIQALDAFLNARTWTDSYREVQAHPELLSDEALALLEQRIATARTVGNSRAVAFFEEHLSLLRRCREVGAAAAFAEKIGVRVEELERRKAKGAVPAVFASWLATAQQAERRFLQTDDRNALATAVEAWRQILEHPAFQTAPLEFRCAVLNDAGGTFLRCYWAQGRAADLERALTFWTEALAATPPDSPDRPSRLNNLGGGLHARYARSGRLDDLDAAIAAWQQALDTTPPDSPDRPGYLTNLGVGLHARYARSGRLEDLDAAIAAWQQALDTTPPDSPDRPSRLNNLGVGLSARYARSGRLDDLDAAIAAWQQALAATPPDSPDRPGYLNNLGNGLSDRYARSGRLDDLDAAIAAYEQALAATPPDSPARPGYLNNLGNGLRDRYARSGRLEDLDAAIAAHEQALDTTPPDSPARPSRLTNLGTGLRARSARSGRLEELNAAIAAYEQALDTTPPDSPDRPGYLNNLGIGLHDRYARSGRLEDLDAAIAAYEQALAATPPGSPDRPSRLTNLGIGLHARYDRNGRLEELEEARNRYAQACQIGQTVHPESVVISSRNWGNWALQRRAWDEVIRAYAFGRQAANTLFAVQTSRVARESWLREVQGLPAGAAYAFARLDRLEEAIVALETGRARMLAEALEANRRDLERLPASGHGDLLARYQAAADRLAALQAQVDRPAAASGGEAGPRRDFAALSQKIQAARAELDAAIAAIRRVPGYEDFFLPPAFEKICQAATPDAPLVYLAATPVGGMALAVHASQTPASAVGQSSAEHDASPDEVQPRRVSVVWLDGLTEAGLREVIFGPADDPELGGYLGAYSEWRRNPRNRAARDGWHAALDRVTRWLWDALMGPLVEHVQALGFRQVTLIPTGLLALLPLHAAWTGDASAPIGRRYALDALTIRYAPSAVALSRSLDGATLLPSDGLLAVDNPDGSLVFSNHEVEAARSYFPSDRTTVLARGAATRQHVLNRLPDFPVYHFSTHGWAGWSEPLQGGMLLAGATLTLGDILDLRLQGARLAVLSACETGIPGTKTPDEVVSIPTGLVQAGVAGVVASLWAVNDLSTAMLMERFYRLWREEGLAPVAALREAQRWLRDTTNREKAEYFKRDTPALAGFRMPEMVAVALFTDRMVQDPDARQFEHPFWWAAFCYTGA